MFSRKPNCEVTVDRGMKPRLFCSVSEFPTGIKEGDGFFMRWNVGGAIAEIRPTKAVDAPVLKRVFPTGKDKPGAKLVGKARLLLTDPDVDPVARFQPVTRVQAWFGWVNDKLMLELTQPLQRASDRSLRAYREAKKARRLAKQVQMSQG